MSRLIDLKKKVGIVLEKQNVSASIMAQVGVAFDITGSMQGMYDKGIVQNLAERLLAVALRFDDNGSLDSWAFCTGSDQLPQITDRNYATYVRDAMLDNSSITKWGGTNYAPVLFDVAAYYFGKTTTEIIKTVSTAPGFFGKLLGKTVETFEQNVTRTAGENDGKMPVYLMFITDGENFDERESWEQLEGLKDENIYVEFIGLGPSSFKFCKDAAEKYGNVGFVHIKDIAQISDEELYSSLLNEEFCQWIKT